MKRVFLLSILLAAFMGALGEDLSYEEMALLAEDEEAEDRSVFYTKRGPTPNTCDGGSCLLNIEESFEPCRMTEKNGGTALVWKSPVGGAGNCSYTYTSEAPGFLKGIYVRLNLEDSDSLKFTGAFGDEYIITNDQLEKSNKFRWPTTYGKLEYSSTVSRNKPVAFVYVAQPQSNMCQRVIEAPANSSGRLTSPRFDKGQGYRAKSMCQWWIRAPEGYKITLKFNSFNVGNNDYGSCMYSDYVGVDKSGDPHYVNSPAKMCGTTLPENVDSDANKINVLFNGKDGGNGGFCFTYHVEPED